MRVCMYVCARAAVCARALVEVIRKTLNDVSQCISLDNYYSFIIVLILHTFVNPAGSQYVRFGHTLGAGTL